MSCYHTVLQAQKQNELALCTECRYIMAACRYKFTVFLELIAVAVPPFRRRYSEWLRSSGSSFIFTFSPKQHWVDGNLLISDPKLTPPTFWPIAGFPERLQREREPFEAMTSKIKNALLGTFEREENNNLFFFINPCLHWLLVSQTASKRKGHKPRFIII
eukprot:scaffold3526_cov153-Amphora_coffeaeformis.AAC.11